ncbi:MAG: hypothetical protein RR641_04715 [Erysipelotrichaceae bacterium]
MPQIIVLYLFLITITLFHQPIDTFLCDLLIERDLSLYKIEDSNAYMLKRVMKARYVLLGLVIWPLLDFDIRYLLIITMLSVFVLKKDYFKLKKTQKQQLKQLRFQFPIWLRQLQILIQTNTVSTSLLLSKENAPSLIKDDLDILIKELKEDAIHLQPYLNFLKRFRLSEIERAMKLLYRYNSVGKEDAYFQFNRMIQSTTKWLRSERYERADSKMMLYQWWGMLPLFGVTVLFMAVMFEIIIDLFGKGVS